VACGAGKTCATVKWTPTETQVPFGMTVSVTNPGSGVVNTVDWNHLDKLTASEVVQIRVSGNTRAPVLKEIAGQTVGADPVGVSPLVSQTLNFTAVAQVPHAADPLYYDLPLLQCMTPATSTCPGDTVHCCPSAGSAVALTQIGATWAQGTDGFGRPTGVITLTNPPQAGNWLLTVRVTDTLSGLTDRKTVNVAVGTFVNHPPQFRINPPTEVFATTGIALTFPVEAQDQDNFDKVNISMSHATSGALFANQAAGTDPLAAPGDRLKIGVLCNTGTVNQDCCESYPLHGTCTVPTGPDGIDCYQLGPNLPNTCNDKSTNPVCSATHPCQKGYFTWTPSSPGTYTVTFDAADSRPSPSPSPLGWMSLTSSAQTVIHVADPGVSVPIEIFGVVPNHGPPQLLNSKVGADCTTSSAADITKCNDGSGVPLGMACKQVQGGAYQCVDTAHLVTVFGQGFTGSSVAATINGTSVLNLTTIGTTAVTFNTPVGTIPSPSPVGLDIKVTNSSAESATLAGGWLYACPSNLCANSNDTNFAGNNACAFVTQFPGCSNPDTDLDGFSDAQEGAGYIDIDCDGQKTGADVVLPSASPSTRDIYVQYDWMAAPTAPENTAEIPSGTDHKPWETCIVGAAAVGKDPNLDCTVVNPGYAGIAPATAGHYAYCLTQNPGLTGNIPDGTVITGAWDRVMAAFGAHSQVSTQQALDPSTEFSLTVDSMATFPAASTLNPISFKVVVSGAPQGVSCYGESGNTFTHCLGGSGTALVGAKVYMGSPDPINLHVIKGQARPHHTVTTFGPLPDTCTINGTSSSLHHDSIDFYQMKASYLHQVNGLAYHYMMFTHFSNCDSCESCVKAGVTGVCAGTGARAPFCPDSNGGPPNFGASGVSTVYGPDVIISTGAAPFTCVEELARSQAGVIAHELGHNLGLLHGGDDSMNRKPNYQSVMNYMYQSLGVQLVAQNYYNTRTDYSEGINLPLQESNLNEAIGLPFNPQKGNPYKTWVLTPDGHGGFNYIAYAANDGLDWDRDGVVEQNAGASGCTSDMTVCCDDIFCSTTNGSPPVNMSCVSDICTESFDINLPTDTIDTKNDFNDWGNLNLLFQCSAAYLPGADQCDENAVSATANPRVRGCYDNNELDPTTSRNEGYGQTGITGVGVVPAKACLDITSHGVIPTTINGSLTLDVHQIILSSIKLGKASPNNLAACSFQTGSNGFPSLKCQFRQDQLGLALGSQRICVLGKLNNGSSFTGCTPIDIKNDPLNPCSN
jgi:hypothetical protein